MFLLNTEMSKTINHQIGIQAKVKIWAHMTLLKFVEFYKKLIISHIIQLYHIHQAVTQWFNGETHKATEQKKLIIYKHMTRWEKSHIRTVITTKHPTPFGSLLYFLRKKKDVKTLIDN